MPRLAKFLATAVVAALAARATAAVDAEPLGRPLRIGYYHGLRIHLLYRAYIGGYFDAEGVSVDFYSQYLNMPGFELVPKGYDELEKKLRNEEGGKSYFGMVRGTDIIDAIDTGILDGGVVGEASFVAAATHGDPIVAVALLGHYTKGFPGRGLVLRDDIHISKPSDFKGLVFASRRSGPGDGMLLREFFASIGLDPSKDVTIIDQVADDQQGELLRKKVVAGLLAHFGKLEEPERLGDVYVYRKMDWVDPATNMALLVFRKDFLAQHRAEVVRMLRGYIARIRYEASIPEARKRRETRNGLRMVSTAADLRLPVCDDPPLVPQNLLDEVQRLLLKYRYIENTADLEKFIDRSAVLEAEHAPR
ncbi:MAG: ABC transporter substrate-binding protein [Elusimicrobia bacterium]|nr:ABC transporter substrate-binding protein [Elusimicrobiota bacterium]